MPGLDNGAFQAREHVIKVDEIARGGWVACQAGQFPIQLGEIVEHSSRGNPLPLSKGLGGRGML
jgi:hypothetical protein